MRLFDFFEKMKLFNALIRQEHTGTPDKFAEKLHISRTTLYEIISECRSYGVKIGYSRVKGTFYYKEPVCLEVRFDIKHEEPLSNSEVKNISGGCKIFPSVLFDGWKDAIFAFKFL
jgi:biotin operon repressor